MKFLKKLVKRYFSSFAFFYSYLGHKIFIAFALSIAVSLMDGLGLAMFFPLLQVVSGDDLSTSSQELGNLSFLIDGIEGLGIPLNLVSILLVMVFFFILKGIAIYLSSIYQVILKMSFMSKLRLDLINSLNKITFKKFVLSDVGRIQNTLTGEVNSIAGAFTSYFGTFQQGLMLAVYIGIAFFVDSQFALLVFIGGMCTHFLYNIIYKYTEQSSNKLTKFTNRFQGEVIQHVNNFKYLRATARIHDYSEKLEESINNIETTRRRIGYWASISSAAREPLLVIIIAIVIFVQLRYFEGKMGAILISLFYFYRALTALVALQLNWNSFLQNIGSMNNMLDFQKHLANNQHKDGKITISNFHDSIQFKNVDFFYDQTQILKNVNITIRKNYTYAFVGESGSGKTTLIHLLVNLLPEDNGQILIDGLPMRQLNAASYQKLIGYISQDAVIFNDTIYNNVTFWAAPTPENIERFWKSVEQASLLKFIQELPENEQTELGNNGINLSGGQKQRISIARELYKDVELLIMDEATSALDSETENEIRESLEALHGQLTIISIAHRLSTIRHADFIYLLDKGEVIAHGSFEELKEKSDYFAKMTALQGL